MEKTIEDTTTLLTIFPEEIWQLVLNRLVNHEDYTALCSTSSFFETRLASHQSRLIFPLVADFLQKQLQAQLHNPESSKQILNIMLTSRLVCSSWNKAITSKLENLHEFFSMNSTRFPIRPNPIMDLFYFNTTNKLKRFKDHFENTHWNTNKNPFIFRTASVSSACETGGAQQKEYYELVHSIFRGYGKHIWYFRNSSDLLRAVDNFTWLRFLLELMPNLKGVTDVGIRRAYPGYYIPPALRQAIESRPFPKLKNLEYIHGTFCDNGFLKPLIDQNEQVSALALYYPETNRFGTEFDIASLPNLKEVSLTIRHFEHFAALEARQYKLNISKLVLNVDKLDIGWDSIFRFVSKTCGKTLKDLELVLNVHNHIQLTRQYELPYLKCLKLTMKRLEIPGTLITSLSFRNKLLESNAFTYLPELNSISCRQQNLNNEYVYASLSRRQWKEQGGEKSTEEKYYQIFMEFLEASDGNMEGSILF